MLMMEKLPFVQSSKAGSRKQLRGNVSSNLYMQLPIFNMFAAVKILACQRLPGYILITMKTGAERSSGNGSQVRNDSQCLESNSSITG